jgi:uncharacterized protein
LRAKQLSWLREVRDKCTTPECLEKAYTQQIQELVDWIIDDGKETSAHRQDATATEVAGQYSRKNTEKNTEAKLTVTALKDNRVRIEGLAE